VSLRERQEELGLKLLSIEVTGNLKKTREVVKDKEGNFPVLLDCRGFSRDVLHITGTPTTLIVDRQGRIRSRLIGYMKNFEEVVGGVLDRI